MTAVKNVMFPLVEPDLPALAEEAAAKDAKSRLQEWSQSEFRETPRYVTVSAEGPDHDKTFKVQVLINDHAWGEGMGRSKQLASQSAATSALEYVDQHINISPVPEPDLALLTVSDDSGDSSDND